MLKICPSVYSNVPVMPPLAVRMVKLSPTAGVNPRCASRFVPWRVIEPFTLSRSYWEPAVAPFSRTRNSASWASWPFPVEWRMPVDAAVPGATKNAVTGPDCPGAAHLRVLGDGAAGHRAVRLIAEHVEPQEPRDTRGHGRGPRVGVVSREGDVEESAGAESAHRKKIQ